MQINIVTPANMTNYGVTKSANFAVFYGLAKRLVGTGVTVNTVLPSSTSTENLAAVVAESILQSDRSTQNETDTFVRIARPSAIIQRAAKVKKVTNLLTYIASPLSAATSGAALRVEGRVIDSLVI